MESNDAENSTKSGEVWNAEPTHPYLSNLAVHEIKSWTSVKLKSSSN